MTKPDADDPLASQWPSGSNARYAYPILALLTFVYAVSWVHRMLLGMFLEPIGRDLHLSDTQLGILTGPAFILCYALGAVPIARLADRRSRRILLSVCVAVWTLATGAMGLFHHLTQLIAARMISGIGESGLSPIVTSLLASTFPRRKLGSVFGLFFAGATVGIALSYPIGGYLLERFGWQKALLIAGLPAAALAPILLLAVRDLRTPAFDAAPPPALRDALRTILQPNMIYMALGATCLGYADAGVFAWFPTFVMRVHDTTPATLGVVMGTVTGVSQGVSLLIGGFLIDHLSSRDARWAAWFPALAALVASPFAAFVYLTPSVDAAIWTLSIPMFLSAAYFAPTVRAIQMSVPESMRAFAVSALFVCINALGYGLGPAIIGAISDALATIVGAQSIRYGLMTTVVAYLAAASSFWTASRHIRGAPVS